jgi:outer membrane protein assembly factor BamE
MRLVRNAVITFAAVMALSACGGGGIRVPVYRVQVNQGNLLEQQLVDAVKPGMTKRQVALVLGTPAIQSPFDQDRWDYTASKGKRGAKPDVKTLTLFFADNALTRMEGDYFPRDEEQLLRDATRMRGRPVDPIEELNAKRAREKAKRGGPGG